MQDAARSGQVFRFGVFEVDRASGELRKQGIRIRLQEQPFQLLLMLLDRPGEVVTREDIRRRLWPPDTFVDFDQGIGTALKKLRQALSDDAEVPRYIETVPKRGFRFIAPLERASTGPAPESSKSAPLVSAAPRHRSQWMPITVAAGVVAALALLIVGTLGFLYRKPPPPSRPIPLTAYEGDELWPDFSPDGNQVVFSWDGAPDGKFHLYANSSARQVICNILFLHGFSVSPDRKTFLFSGQQGSTSNLMRVENFR